jgi:hypothetical protein
MLVPCPVLREAKARQTRGVLRDRVDRKGPVLKRERKSPWRVEKDENATGEQVSFQCPSMDVDF